jgi:hypothetical protein
MRVPIWLSLLILLGVGITAAQEKPDFTGQWVLLTPRDAGDAAPRLSVRQWLEHKTTVRGAPIDIPHVAIERQFQNGMRSERYQIGIVGGMAGGLAAGAGVQSWTTRYAVKWDSERLVIETGRYSGPTRESGPYSEHDEVWSLDASGRLVITVTDRDSGSSPRTIVLTYQRP